MGLWQLALLRLAPAVLKAAEKALTRLVSVKKGDVPVYPKSFPRVRDPQCGWYSNWDDEDEWWECWSYWPRWGWEFVFWVW